MADKPNCISLDLTSTDKTHLVAVCRGIASELASLKADRSLPGVCRNPWLLSNMEKRETFLKALQEILLKYINDLD